MAPRHVAAALAAIALLSGCSHVPAIGPIEPGAGLVLPADQEQASALVSDYRKQHGLSAVTRDPKLQQVAQAQADAMASANLLSHTVGGSLPDRLAVVGRARGASVENVSAGYADFAKAFAGWQRSPPHNANLLFGPMRRIGVAGAAAPGSRYKTYWALVMTD